MTRANAARTRQADWHQACLRAAQTAGERLSAACDWLRAEARRAGPDAVAEATARVLAHIAELREATKPKPTTDQEG